MNQVLRERYTALGAEEKQQVKFRLKDSPRALKLISFLEQRKDRKVNTMEVVRFLYADSSDEFSVLRNRFFKLRKQLLEMMEGGEQKSDGGSKELLPLEQKLYHCRKLVSENHFQIARKELKELVAECREQQIFEIYSEAVGQLIYCNLAMNVLKENEKLSDELVLASKLLHDMRVMQSLGRKSYYCVHSREFAKIHVHIRHMRRIAIRRKHYPRFRLFYHFTVITNTAGLPGVSTKAIARHFTSLKRLMEKHPGTPAGFYEPNWAKIMQFYLHVAEGTHHYMKGNVNACYRLFKEAWEIQDKTPNLRIRKSESHFSNRIAIEVATGRFKEALKTAEDLIEFQKEQHQEEKRLKGYADIAVIYTYAWPTLVCKDTDFIRDKLKQYISVLRKNDSVQLNDALTIQAVFLFLAGDYRNANKVAKIPGVMKLFSGMGVGVYNDLLQLSLRSSREEIGNVKEKAQQLLHRSVSSDHVLTAKRALNLIRKLEG
jgi:hypothetical protein